MEKLKVRVSLLETFWSIRTQQSESMTTRQVLSALLQSIQVMLQGRRHWAVAVWTVAVAQLTAMLSGLVVNHSIHAQRLKPPFPMQIAKLETSHRHIQERRWCTCWLPDWLCLLDRGSDIPGGIYH